MRGEHASRFSSPASTKGSSPHARGALTLLPPPSLRHRIIPACAGSTPCGRGFLATVRDHPRMRGEHPRTSHNVALIQGSSPHARGARARKRPPIRWEGIIPACAGSTIACSISLRPRWDHPRMRGEHFGNGKLGSFFGGSSPHARGAQRAALSTPIQAGIIPACAGSTWCDKCDCA